MDSQPATPLCFLLLPTLRDPSFDIFLWDNLDKTYNKTGKTTIEIIMITLTMLPGLCYESPKKEIVSRTFEHLIYNLKSYNGVEI